MASLEDPQLLSAAASAIAHFESTKPAATDATRLALVRVTAATHQVVAGAKYVISMELVRVSSSCEAPIVGPLRVTPACPAIAGAELVTVDASIWVQPWRTPAAIVEIL